MNLMGITMSGSSSQEPSHVVEVCAGFIALPSRLLLSFTFTCTCNQSIQHFHIAGWTCTCTGTFYLLSPCFQ